MSDSEALTGPSDHKAQISSTKPARESRKPKTKAPALVKIKPPPKPKPEPTPYRPTSDPGADEQNDVHEVYERIAPHFSQTRHKQPWPLISTFLHSLPPNSIGLDSGGGNGKYVPTAREAGVGLVVMDRSLGLLSVARGQAGFGLGDKGKGREDLGFQELRIDDVGTGSGEVGECVRGDLTGEGWRRGVFDFAISIAAIHHLTTPARRRRSVQALLQPLVHAPKPPYARFMIYVWAYEQSSGSKRRMGATAGPADSAPSGTDQGERVQDVLVPWVLQPPKVSASATSERGAEEGDASRVEVSDAGKATGETKPEPESQVLHRYYHLFVKGELRDLVFSAAEEEGYKLLPFGNEGKEREGTSQSSPGPGEKWLRVKAEGWEADNWWIEGEVGIGPIIEA